MSAKRVLLADDDRELAAALELRCRCLGLNVMVAHDAMTALQLAHGNKLDLMVVDVEMPAGNGLSVCEMLYSDAKYKFPVVVLTGKTDDTVIRRCHEMCAYYVLKGANVWDRVGPLIHELLGLEADGFGDEEMPPEEECARRRAEPRVARCRSLLENVFALLGCQADYLHGHEGRFGESRYREHSPDAVPWVLCIDDDDDFTWVLQRRLEDSGVAVVRAFDGSDGYRAAFADPADVILLDYEMPNGRGDYVLSRLKENSITREIPVIVLTGRRDRALKRRLLNMGAAAFFNKPVDFPMLRQELERYINLVPDPCR
ncbi:MAG: response regulator [Pirellulaceae bacterium]